MTTTTTVGRRRRYVLCGDDLVDREHIVVVESLTFLHRCLTFLADTQIILPSNAHCLGW